MLKTFAIIQVLLGVVAMLYAYSRWKCSSRRKKTVPPTIFDFNMPGMSGPETAEKIRKYEEDNGIASQHVSAKILMVTAMSDGKSIMSSFKGGCEGYLKKPFNKEEIAKSLSAIGI